MTKKEKEIYELARSYAVLYMTKGQKGSNKLTPKQKEILDKIEEMKEENPEHHWYINRGFVGGIRNGNKI